MTRLFRLEGLHIVWAAQVEGAWAWGTPVAPRARGSCSQRPPPLAPTRPPQPAQAAGDAGGAADGGLAAARLHRWAPPSMAMMVMTTKSARGHFFLRRIALRGTQCRNGWSPAPSESEGGRRSGTSLVGGRVGGMIARRYRLQSTDHTWE